MSEKRRSDKLPREKILLLYQRLTMSPQKHFQKALAAELECSPQTIARLVDTIEVHIGKDASIERGIENKKRFYRYQSEAQKNGLGFDFEELHYLAVCRDFAASQLPPPVAQRIDKTLRDLALQLSEGEALQPRSGAVGFRSKGYIDYQPHQPTINALRLAIENQRVCDVVYRAMGRAENKSYRYAPGRILAMNGTLYVQGYQMDEGSLQKGRPTTLSLHRISVLSPTGEHFSFNAADDEACSFGLNWHPPKRIRVEVSAQAADYVRDRIWSADQTVDEHDDGSLSLTVTTTSEKELNAWIWSFGGLAHVA
ncbi:helix-turn-helix transcriptional regulator [Lacibacterium aquatile]|uniref:Helix-turn-helix transcriptional regulator n=1 Tax=Lacibacterium aquatile TaxID=1168082 RepID=A0ABW5DNV5_9PROT